MYNELTIEKYKNSINENDEAYLKFSPGKVYKKFYVESYDDVIFYKNFLSNIYCLPADSLQFNVCHCKENVLKKYTSYIGNKFGFIVDLDYLPIKTDKFKKVIITTGYSMENFYFYEESGFSNLYYIFRHFYRNNKECKIAYNNYIKQLQDFKKETLQYFAFFKTCMEVYGLTNHLKIKDILIEKDEYFHAINDEIENMPTYIKYKFRSRFEDNIGILKNSGYMMLRGHDLFNNLVEFLRNDGNNVKESQILKLSSNINMPYDFKRQFINDLI